MSKSTMAGTVETGGRRSGVGEIDQIIKVIGDLQIVGEMIFLKRSIPGRQVSVVSIQQLDKCPATDLIQGWVLSQR